MSDAIVLEPTGRPGRVKVSPGRTYVSYFEDRLVWAEVYKTPEAAQQWADGETTRMGDRRQSYIDKGLPVPTQLTKWTFKVI